MRLKSEVVIQGDTYRLTVFKERRNNIRASVRNRNINVRMPGYLKAEQASRHLNDILSRLEKDFRANPPEPLPELRKYIDGQVLSIGPDDYTLRISRENISSGTAKYIEPGTISIRLPLGMTEFQEREAIGSLVSRCAAKRSQAGVKALARELNRRHFDYSLEQIRLKNTKSRWGSCSKKGNINLSTRLLFAPREILEYVIIHELAHLGEMNHSARFWSIVASADPNYKSKIEWLKKNGKDLHF